MSKDLKEVMNGSCGYPGQSMGDRESSKCKGSQVGVLPGLFTEEQKGPVMGMKPARERVGRDEIREVTEPDVVGSCRPL